MAMGPERSKPLHNFSLPCLKWGNQRVLRCIKLTTEPSPSPSPSPSLLDRRSPSRRFQPKNQNDNPFHNSKRKANDIDLDLDDNLNNIDAVREKLMIDLRVAANNLKVSIFEESVAAAAAADDPTTPSTAANSRPWNLRTRRAACKAPNREEQRNLDSGSSPARVGEAVAAKEKENPKSAEKNQKMMMNERGKFSVSLSKEEVEQDFWALVGTRPPRRPKKRPRTVQKKLDTLFPGLWLTEVTAESYKVPEVPE